MSSSLVHEELNRSNLSARRNNRTPDRMRQNHSQVDMSIDNEYLNEVDRIQQENQKFVIEIEKLRQQVDRESNRVFEAGKDNESLLQRIQELQLINQKNENLAAEKHKQLEYEIQMKVQQV